jgi:hypothetical protein
MRIPRKLAYGAGAAAAMANRQVQIVPAALQRTNLQSAAQPTPQTKVDHAQGSRAPHFVKVYTLR